MLKQILGASLAIGLCVGATHAEAAIKQTAPAVAPPPVQPVFWTRDAYGRPVWVPGYPRHWHRRWHHRWYR